MRHLTTNELINKSTAPTGATKIYFYQNLRNPHKFIEVRCDGHYHSTVRQFLYWRATSVLNFTGDGNLHRWRKDNLAELLSDYRLVKYFV